MAAKNSVSPHMLRSVFAALPSLIFVVDEDVRIQEYNAAAAGFLSVQRSAILSRANNKRIERLADLKF